MLACSFFKLLNNSSSSVTAAVLTHRAIFKEGLNKGLCLCFHPVWDWASNPSMGEKMHGKHLSKPERFKHLSCFFLSRYDFFLLPPPPHFTFMLFSSCYWSITYFFKHKPFFSWLAVWSRKCRYQETLKSWRTRALAGLMMGGWEIDG